ncbi:copper chaperone [Beggiatoa alba B18LD]|uniref:Copper chaperone n=1 Tax=Beggiatoa alba B18LD TaxID=395493 RepID=I3CEV9_9GAMM|nr:heavy metal-associated domain-containing protein [Beggiatoa alba]EIJ42152.1 copper chaperone [Beggiatoa alba B18LD]
MEQVILASNIKCSGCAKTIQEGLTTLAGVQQITVDVPEGKVTVTGDNLQRSALTQKLAELGYPEKTATSGLVNIMQKAKGLFAGK